MIELKLFDSGEESDHVHRDIELLYVLKGQLRVRINEKAYDLRQSDVIAVNANTQHGLRVPDQSIICRVSMKYNAFLESVQRNYALLWCNSAAAGSAAYHELRSILDEMIDIWLVSKKSRYIRQSVTYRLIGCLAENFMMTADGADEQAGDKNARKDAMLRYISANYFREITLQEMADNSYMTQSAFSKYFKKTVGTNFIEYLNRIRLHYAVQDLLFSDKPITHIAMDNGFSSPSAFNKHFRTVYRMTPTRFRDSMKTDLEPAGQVSGDDNELARWYLEEKQKTQENKGEERWISADVLSGSPGSNAWTAAVNLGPAGMLLSETYKKQVLTARKRLQFQYGRIRELFAEEMHCFSSDKPGQMTFDLQDDVLDFMREHDIIPMIVLDIGRRLRDPDPAAGAIQSWIKHAAARYGKACVSRWVFEVPVDMGMITQDVSSEEPSGAYARILQTIRDEIPGCKAGAYLPSAEQALKFVRKLSRQECAPGILPDHIAVDVFLPKWSDTPDNAGSILPDHRNLLPDAAGMLCDVCDDLSLPVCFSRWNLSSSENDAYNDSCQKAALMLSNMTKACGKVQFGIYSCLSDLENSYNESITSRLGGSGLLHKDGIPKPSFHALSFMSRLLPILISKEEGCIITADQHGHYMILCFNARDVGQEYYLKKEENISREDVRHISVDEEPQTFHISLQNIQNSVYHIKKLSISPEGTKALMEWNMQEQADPDPFEREYMRYVNMPVVTVDSRQVQENTMVMHESLEANEICLYELY